MVQDLKTEKAGKKPRTEKAPKQTSVPMEETVELLTGDDMGMALSDGEDDEEEDDDDDDDDDNDGGSKKQDDNGIGDYSDDDRDKSIVK